MEKEIELLAPAGSYDMARAVISAGADAVYFAGTDFGARAYADNFDREEARTLIRLMHLHGKKAYLTVNTLLKNLEMEKQLLKYLKFYYEAGLDAVLIQDFGVSELISNYFPDLNRHASTQMNIASKFGAGLLKEHGFSRIVAARELSINELAAIHKECDIEIEAFIHGALCVCYSGQCLMSSFLGGRSGNRGRCAQPCRLPYNVMYPDGSLIKTRGPYVLSPKDLCAIDHLPELIEAGVCSLKIEGRMKQPAYAGEVTAVYRRYLDLYFEHGSEKYKVSKKDYTRLLNSGSRGGFTSAYFDIRHTPGMMSFEDSAHKADTTASFNAKEIDRKLKLGICGCFTARPDEAISLNLSCRDAKVTVKGDICQKAINRPTSAEEIRVRLDRLGESPFFWQDISIDITGSAFIPLKEINELRREAVDKLEDRLLAQYDRSYSQKRFEPVLYKDLKQDGKTRPDVIIRVTTEAQLRSAEESGIADRIILPFELWNKVPTKERYIFGLPVVVRYDTAARCGRFIKENTDMYYEASSYDGLGLLYSLGIASDHILGGHRLYALSNRTKRAFNLASGKVPLELSASEISHRDNSGDGMLVYGRIPLMYMTNCIARDAGLCRGDHAEAGREKDRFLYLKDRKGKQLPVMCDCIECQNVIYNALPLDLMDRFEDIYKMGVRSLEISFTTEDAHDVSVVLLRLKRALEGLFEKPPYEYTRGHYGKSIQ